MLRLRAARVGLAALALRDGRLADAIEHLEAARRIEPTDSLILERLAGAHAALGDRSRADEIERARAGLTALGHPPAPTRRVFLLLPNDLR